MSGEPDSEPIMQRRRGPGDAAMGRGYTDWIVALFTALGFFAAAAGALVVGIQLRETWRQNTLDYLQIRGQDFLQFEYGSKSIGCIYDWWTPRGNSKKVDNVLQTSSAFAADKQCQFLYNNYSEYARTMLYIEETLMYFAEEARIACVEEVSYGRELDIWRQDVISDPSGIFSYYILSRFSDPELGYAARLGQTLSPEQNVIRYIEKARLFGVTLEGLCSRSAYFRSMTKFETRQSEGEREVCKKPSNSVIGSGIPKNPYDEEYCRSIHYVAPSRIEDFFDWLEEFNDKVD